MQKNLECSGLLTNCRTMFINLSKFILRLNNSYQRCLELFIIGFQRLHLLFFSKLRFLIPFGNAKNWPGVSLCDRFSNSAKLGFHMSAKTVSKRQKTTRLRNLVFFQIPDSQIVSVSHFREFGRCVFFQITIQNAF